MSTDLYKGMSEFYDTFVQSNRDYKAIATELIELFGNSVNILDVGIGTGLLVKEIIQLRPDLKITGIDSSASLLAQAEKSLGSEVALFCQDVCNLELEQRFELAYSRGGAWAFVKDDDQILLASHILETDAIRRSFERIARHLSDGGCLILTTSNANSSKRKNLNSEVSFERVVSKEWIDGQQYLLLEYMHHRSGSIVGQQRVKMLLLDLESVEQMLNSVGLISRSDSHNQYRIYQKTESA